MPGEKIGMNLLMCIPPDHMRDDLPTTVSPWDVYEFAAGSFKPCVYVGITDDMGNTVTLPCFDIQAIDGKCVLMAHRTGRPVGSPTPKPEPLASEPLPEVAKLPEGTKVIVTWRYADGHEDESGNTIWLGNIVESFGPSDTCFRPRVDGTLREKAPSGYAQPVRWRLAEEPRP